MVPLPFLESEDFYVFILLVLQDRDGRFLPRGGASVMKTLKSFFSFPHRIVSPGIVPDCFPLTPPLPSGESFFSLSCSYRCFLTSFLTFFSLFAIQCTGILGFLSPLTSCKTLQSPSIRFRLREFSLPPRFEKLSLSSLFSFQRDLLFKR